MQRYTEKEANDCEPTRPVKSKTEFCTSQSHCLGDFPSSFCTLDLLPPNSNLPLGFVTNQSHLSHTIHMRIRKRCPTAQSLAPSPESLYLLQKSRPNDPPVEDIPLPAPPRSDLQLTLVKGNNGWICKTDDDYMQSKPSTQLWEEASPYYNKIGKLPAAATVHAKYSDNNHTGAEDSEGISSSESASHLEMDSTMKTGINLTRKENGSTGMMKKKRRKVDKDSAMTDGTRCSRVNGRGWRCWKPTVVGYSLCVHHSIQGRLKSKDEKQAAESLVLLDEEPLIMLKKRKKKIGMVKNRSISSLLAQTEPQPAPTIPVLDPIATL